ncbi:unnamed protein product [Effrenium voratum]|nr:unnamed protein product [Effrenium voratum]
MMEQIRRISLPMTLSRKDSSEGESRGSPEEPEMVDDRQPQPTRILVQKVPPHGPKSSQAAQRPQKEEAQLIISGRKLTVMPVLTEHGIVHTTVIPTPEGYTIPVLKTGDGFALPAVAVDDQVRVRSSEESEESTEDLSDGEASWVEVEGPQPRLSQEELIMISELQEAQSAYMHDKADMTRSHKTACKELLQWLIRMAERGGAEAREFQALEAAHLEGALQQQDVMDAVKKILQQAGSKAGRAGIHPATSPPEPRQGAKHEAKGPPFGPEVVSIILDNVPATVQQWELLDEVNSRGFHHKVDFLYLPASAAGNNDGFGILNFTQPEFAHEFYKAFHGTFLQLRPQGKALAVTRAPLQGRETLWERFKGAASDAEQSANHGPLLLNPSAKKMSQPKVMHAAEFESQQVCPHCSSLVWGYKVCYRCGAKVANSASRRN